MKSARRILVADDNDDLREMVRRGLEAHGFIVTAVDGGIAAVNEWERARASGQPYCALLVDIAMPDKTGYDVTEYVRTHQEGNGTPVLLMTAKDEPLVEAHARRSEADTVIYKPFDLNEMVHQVNDLCDAKVLMDRVRDKIISGQLIDEPDRAATTSYLRRLMGDKSLPHIRRTSAHVLLSALENR